MIPNPLTLLLCWLIGVGLSGLLDYVLQFAGELLVDAQRFGWIGDGSFAAALGGLGIVALFASGFFIGAAMCLLADRSWRKAGAWALAAMLLSHLRTPRVLLFAAPGCFLGAYLCGRYRSERWLEGAEVALRPWMIWDRGGAL